MEQEIESLRNISDEEPDNQIRILSKILFPKYLSTVIPMATYIVICTI